MPAPKDIHLQSSQDSRKQDHHHSGSSASIGVGFSFGGEQNGFTLELAAAGNKGKAQGTGTTHHVTDITAGNTLSLTSGRDTTLHGAQAKGQTIDAHIGRDLTLTSTQDNNHYTEKDQSGGVGLSLCIPPFCYGTSGGSASYSQNDIKNTYQSVTDQTGLAAGQGGFDIHVGGTTALTGAAIASTADPSKNRLDTDNLKLNSLRNIAISSANQTGASINTSGSLGSNITQNAEGATLNLAIPQGGNQISNTESRIAQGTIRVRNHPGQDLSGINRDATTLDGNGVTNDFDLDQIKRNQELGQAAGYAGMRMAGDIAEYEQRQAVNDLIQAKSKNDKAAEADAKARLANWGSGGRNKVILHGMIGAATAALGGGNAAQGAIGAAASEAASGVMQNYLKTHDIKPNSATGNTLMSLASTAIGAAAGDGNGAVTALYGDKYNRQLHSEESDALAALQKGKTAEEKHRLNAAACALAHCAQGVPESDPDKAKLIALQQEGSQYQAEQATLAQTGLFQYGWLDSTGDFLQYHDQAVTKTEGVAQMLGGASGVAGGYALAAGGCATGLGCVIAAPVGATISGTSAVAYKQGYDQLTQPYQSEIGQQVIDSFNPETYPGESHPTLNLATNVGTNVLLTGTGATSLKALKYADDWSGAAVALGQSIDRATDAARQTRTVGLKIADHVSKQVLGTRMGDGLIAGGSNAAAQLVQNGGQVDQINWIDVGTTTTAGVLGHGRGLGTSIAIGAGAGVASTEADNLVNGTDRSPWLGALSGGLAGGVGYGVGNGATSIFRWRGESALKSHTYGTGAGAVGSEVISGLWQQGTEIIRSNKKSPNDNGMDR